MSLWLLNKLPHSVPLRPTPNKRARTLSAYSLISLLTSLLPDSGMSHAKICHRHRCFFGARDVFFFGHVQGPELGTPRASPGNGNALPSIHFLPLSSKTSGAREGLSAAFREATLQGALRACVGDTGEGGCFFFLSFPFLSILSAAPLSVVLASGDVLRTALLARDTGTEASGPPVTRAPNVAKSVHRDAEVQACAAVRASYRLLISYL